MVKFKKDECEWCGTSSPRIDNKCFGDYMELKDLFGKYNHKICLECYKHMSRVK